MTNPGPSSSTPKNKPSQAADHLDENDDPSCLLNSMDIAAVFLDTQLRIRRFTPAMKDLMDLLPSDVGRPLNDAARKFDDPDLIDDIQAVLGKQWTSLEKEVASESGRTYMRRVLPYRTADNHIDGGVVTFFDISRRKRAESALRESEERYRLILENINEYAIVMLDTEGHFITWSHGAERVLGFSRQEAIGLSWSEIFTTGDRIANEPEKRLRLARESGSASEERWCVRKGGSQFWCSGIVSSINDSSGKLMGYVKVLRDNTERKRVEEELQAAKRAAEIANKSKDLFLANISHELRTPLSVMLLWANLLENKTVFEPGELREGLKAIRQSAEAQKELTEDLIDTSRIVAGKLRLELQKIELVSVVNAAVEAIRPAAAAKSIRVETELDSNAGLVRADPNRLQQVVWNLLSNAVKFTPSGGHINVAMRRQGKEVEIRVADTGQGISEDFLPHVFDRFGQADPSAIRAKGGLGLGLTIARQLVDLHGGTISAQSAGIERGAVFTVRLPLAPLAFAAGEKAFRNAPPSTVAKRLGGFRILLVEDESEVRKALISLLQEAGARVVPAATAASALQEFKFIQPDLLVSDIDLPDGDGFELLEKIRELEKQENRSPTPALALTAYATEKNRLRASASSFQEYLTKPVEALRLISALAALLSQQP